MQAASSSQVLALKEGHFVVLFRFPDTMVNQTPRHYLIITVESGASKKSERGDAYS